MRPEEYDIFFVISNLKTLSFKFCYDIFFDFEMPRLNYQRPIGKMNISLLFRPFASDVLGLCEGNNSDVRK